MASPDPTTLAVVSGTLDNTIREMTITMRRAAMSPVLAVGNDFSNAIFDGSPVMVMQGQDQPVHLGAMIFACKQVAGYFAGGLAPGDVPTVREALEVMISVSSNAAAHALLRTLGRHDFNMALASAGLHDTRVPELDGSDQSDLDSAVTTAADISHLLHEVARARGLSSAMQAELLRLLSSGGPPDALRETLPEEVTVLDKTGNLDDASNVGALLQSARGAVLLVVLNRGVDPGDARAVIARLGRTAYENFLQLQVQPEPESDEPRSD
jgi:hypothetical protein